MKIFLIKNYRKSYTNQLLETLIKEKYFHLLLIISGDVADMKFRILLCAIDIYSKYA